MIRFSTDGGLRGGDYTYFFRAVGGCSLWLGLDEYFGVGGCRDIHPPFFSLTSVGIEIDLGAVIR